MYFESKCDNLKRRGASKEAIEECKKKRGTTKFPSVKYLIERKHDLNCECGAGVSIKNLTEQTIKVPLTKSVKIFNGLNYRELKPQDTNWTLLPKAKQKLGCAINKDKDGLCRIYSDWKPHSIAGEGLNEIQKIIPASILENPLLLAQPITVSLSKSCKKECIGEKDSENCFNYDLGEEELKYDKGLTSLYKELRGKNSHKITNNKMLGLFDMTAESDLCKRNATLISDGIMSNSGESVCNIKATIGSSQDEFLELTVPLTLQGFLNESENWVSINFPNPQHSMKLKFSDDGLSKNWGGTISEIEGDGKYIIAKTTKNLNQTTVEDSCILIRASN